MVEAVKEEDVEEAVKEEDRPLCCTLGTVNQPQPAVILVLDHQVQEQDIAQFLAYLKTLRISAFVERSTHDELVFVCLYLTPEVCEVMAQRLSYHVPFHTYKSKNPPDAWTSKLYSLLTYGTLSYNSFTEIEYSVMFHEKLKGRLEPDKMRHLYSVRVQAEMIYHVLQSEEVFRCNTIRIKSHFVPHTPENSELWSKMSWFPPLFPLKEFRDYFGEELAFTYAWSNFWWIFGIVPISIFAFFCLIIGLASQNYHEIADKSWPLFAKVMVNPSTNYYVIFVMIWIAVFQNQWSSAAPILSLQWAVSSYYKEEPCYKSPEQVRYRKLLRLPNLIISLVGIVVAAACCAILLLAVEVLLRTQLKDQLEIGYVNVICPFIYTILNTVLGSFFIPPLSRFLTNLEDHKFQSYYTNSVIFKYTGYYLMSSYCYLAFLAMDFHTFVFEHYGITLRVPEVDSRQFEVRELSQQLIFLIVVLRLKGVTKSFFFWCLRKFQNRKILNQAENRHTGDLSYILDNYKAFSLLDTSDTSLWMSDRVIMYGYLTVFSYHVPVVAFLALVLELLVTQYEMRMLLRNSQRPRPRRVGNIKQWQGILYLVNIMSIIINAYSIHLRNQAADAEERDCWIIHDNNSSLLDDKQRREDQCVFDKELLPFLFMPIFMGVLSLIEIQSSFSGDKHQMHIRNQYQMGIELFADDFISTDSGPTKVDI